MVPSPPAQRAGGGGRKPAPIPAQRNAGHPDPLPASVILHLASGCPLTGISGSRVQDDGGVGGGSGGRGLDSSSRATTPGLGNKKPSTNPTISPFFPGIAPTIRPHIRGGGALLGGRGGWLG